MAEHDVTSRGDAADDNEDNIAQRQSDATPDAVAEQAGDLTTAADRADGHGSTANGTSPADEADGELRRKQYKEGATLVSRMD